MACKRPSVRFRLTPPRLIPMKLLSLFAAPLRRHFVSSKRRPRMFQVEGPQFIEPSSQATVRITIRPFEQAHSADIRIRSDGSLRCLTSRLSVRLTAVPRTLDIAVEASRLNKGSVMIECSVLDSDGDVIRWSACFIESAPEASRMALQYRQRYEPETWVVSKGEAPNSATIGA